jgi:hypothetical protein
MVADSEPTLRAEQLSLNASISMERDCKSWPQHKYPRRFRQDDFTGLISPWTPDSFRLADDPPQSDIGSCEAVLVLFTEEITHAHNGIDLFRSESRQKIPTNRVRVYRARSFQLLSAEFSKHDENSVPVRMAAFNESALLHSRQLVREAAFVPSHHSGQCLLAHFTFAQCGETRQNSKFRA